MRAAVDTALRSLAARLAAQAGIEAPAAVAVAVEKGEAGAKKEAEASPLRRGPPDPEEKAAAARAAAVSAATWAFVQQRISSPRDMSGAAVSAFRAATLGALADLSF